MGWAAIVQKTLAILYGSYDALASGCSFEAFSFITGKPVEHIILSEIPEDQRQEKVIKLLRGYLEKKYPVTCGLDVPEAEKKGHFLGIYKIEGDWIYLYETNKKAEYKTREEKFGFVPLASEHVGPGKVRVAVTDFLKDINDITVCLFDYERVAEFTDEIPREGLVVSHDSNADREIVFECYEDPSTFLKRRTDKSVPKLRVEYIEPSGTNLEISATFRAQRILSSSDSNRSWVILPCADDMISPKMVAYRAKDSKLQIEFKSRVDDYEVVTELGGVPVGGYYTLENHDDRPPKAGEILVALYGDDKDPSNSSPICQDVRFIPPSGTPTSMMFKTSFANPEVPMFLNDKRVDKTMVLDCLQPNAPMPLCPVREEARNAFPDAFRSPTRVVLYRRKSSSLNVMLKSHGTGE